MGKRNVLITGGTGLLGRYLLAAGKNHEIRAVYFGKYTVANEAGVTHMNGDIRDRAFLRRVISGFSPVAVIHTAGIANVDYCEAHPAEARESLVAGTDNIIQLCRETGAKLIFVSTNAVFDGEHAPYAENDPPNPISEYGRLKLECERMVAESGQPYAIARPILMHGWNDPNERGNTVTWLLQKLTQGEQVNMVDDVYENPLYAGSAARTMWSLLSGEGTGIYHIAGRDIVSRYDFALKVAEVFGLDGALINPVGSDFFETLLRRPRNTSYRTTRMETELGVEPQSLEAGLVLMRNERQTS